jgi:prepilin-type N-terminal cleavage/methylation domain-containing protein
MTHSSQCRRGFALIEIMAVLLILMILVGGYSHFGGFGESVDKGTATSTMDRANDTACRASRAAVAGNIEMWEMSHVGQAATSVSLAEANISMRCPHSRTGASYVLVRGTVYCTEHYPPPASRPATPSDDIASQGSSLGRTGSASSHAGSSSSTGGGRRNPLGPDAPRLPAMP